MTPPKRRNQPPEPPWLCTIRSHHWHEFWGAHADVTHLQGTPVEPKRPPRRGFHPMVDGIDYDSSEQ